MGNKTQFLYFPVHGKKRKKWHEKMLGGVFPTNPSLLYILGTTYFHSDTRNYSFFWIPDFQITVFPDVQTPALVLAPDELSDPNLPPFPTHPGIK